MLLGKRRRLDLDRGDGGRRKREREKALVLLCGCLTSDVMYVALRDIKTYGRGGHGGVEQGKIGRRKSGSRLDARALNGCAEFEGQEQERGRDGNVSGLGGTRA